MNSCKPVTLNPDVEGWSQKPLMLFRCLECSPSLSGPSLGALLGAPYPSSVLHVGVTLFGVTSPRDGTVMVIVIYSSVFPVG